MSWRRGLPKITISLDITEGAFEFDEIERQIKERVNEYAQRGMYREAQTLGLIQNLVSFGIHYANTSVRFPLLPADKDNDSGK